MKSENIVKRIENFFTDYEEPKRTEYVNYACKTFAGLRKTMDKSYSDSYVIRSAIVLTISKYRL